MSGTSLPSVPVPTIDATGVHVPTFEEYYDYVVGVVQYLYGSDINIDPDTQDGQFLGVQAQAMSDMANAACNSYNAMSPNTAQGVGLSSVVKINGIARQSAFNSTVLQQINGDVGVTITNGIVSDPDGLNQWALPPSVTIPTGGTINVTATCVTAGPVAAAENSITVIQTPTAGWLSTTNVAAAAPGQPVEVDGALRIRQTLSVALPAENLVIALQADLLALAGVIDAVVYENDTGTTNGDGVPAHSIWPVVFGGNNADIGTTIAIGKGPGCGTYGGESYTYYPPNGQPPLTVNYGIPTQVRMIAAITVKSLSAYTSDVGVEIKNSLAAYVNGVGIGAIVEWDLAITNAKWLGNPDNTPFNNDSLSFRIQALTLAIYGNSLEPNDVTIPDGEIAVLAVSDITLTVV